MGLKQKIHMGIDEFIDDEKIVKNDNLTLSNASLVLFVD